MEDDEIVTLYQRRDEQAIRATAEKYGGYCLHIAQNLLGIREDAEECVNDVYFALWSRIPPELPRCLRTFLGRVTRNISISRFRALRAQKRYSGMEILLSELDDCVPATENVERAAEQRALPGIISDWLESLPTDDCILFVRRYWYGDTTKALAQRTSCTENQMAQRMLRLRKSLKHYLEQKGVSL
ncbi:MAG: sigma-70 family RNA polymerase sigma factor [Oscillospiraceae bacterium]|nr:sigma-70 family RNA polymerase sigma factor [Oscillospiraceae bacterium]MCC8091017.1 sigma-70 family RNA polymerase sigma factor [Oscillospiraceae bacterium]MCC8156175.1 sigma-70 family RNA polymerase sigma factor [Oscillospiraceae bacterium]MCD7768473.1 sigma-70 family RNA polymerase sigma factor [Oscillospiraceae bacterium]MCD7786285.1 sigma-70 family RNA polymerase sigma factor [Oscillospiraceae bacterium]